jgi:hypothetical protein
MRETGPEVARNERWRIAALGFVPLLILIAAISGLGPEKIDSGAGQTRAFEPPKHFRTVVMILDSAGKSEMFDPALMPFVSSLRATSLSGRSRSCSAKATFPCIKSIFEGREATMGSTLQDFSAFASSRTTWPASLAAIGMRLVVASDHTLNRLYPHAFVDSIDYENLHASILEGDAIVFRKARQWLDDPTIDGLVLHVLGTDKIAHEYPVRGPVYRQKYREVDDFIREVAGRLQPDDYLFVISDHGHNQLGGHTEDAAYVAQGPLFPADLHQDLNSEDMLFLLSLPYGLILPDTYEGQIRLDLTRLAPETGERWLAAQAKVVRVPIEGLPLDQAEARVNEKILRRHTEDQRGAALEALWRSVPFWIATALFLIRELPFRRRSEGKRGQLLQIAFFAFGLALVWMGFAFAAWFFAMAAFLRCLERFGPAMSVASLFAVCLLGVAAFWIFPAGLPWITKDAHRPLGFATFYIAAAAIGLALARWRGLDSWRTRIPEMLLVIGISAWLLGYFGPLGYSLTRHASRALLPILPIAAVIIAGGFRTFASRPALFLLGLLPFALYDVESFNLRYPGLDRIHQLPVIAQLVLAGIAANLFVLALPRGRKLMPFLLISVWLSLGALFFQFELSRLIGGLLACMWLAGSLELFRRARLPTRWFSLVSVLFLFILLTFFLNGFALSHVDFRFAANKIFPFAREVWRAPQLILWAMLKYAFALVPAFAVLRASSAGERVWSDLLLLGWWRQLTIVAGALGLAVFEGGGMRDLCSEEIYFWTFLNIVLWAGCWLSRPQTPRSEDLSRPGDLERPVPALG